MTRVTQLLKVVILFLATSWTTHSLAQRIEHVEAEIQGDQVLVTYDLVGVQEGQTFQVLLFTSANSFLSPMEKVAGQVGEDVKPGTGNQITWNPKKSW